VAGIQGILALTLDGDNGGIGFIRVTGVLVSITTIMIVIRMLALMGMMLLVTRVAIVIRLRRIERNTSRDV
jgi:hypothetical protein